MPHADRGRMMLFIISARNESGAFAKLLRRRFKLKLKKIMAMLFCVAMVFSTVSYSAFADDFEFVLGGDLDLSNPPASSEGTVEATKTFTVAISALVSEADTLEEAFAACDLWAPNMGILGYPVIKLNADYVMEAPIVIDVDYPVTIDLNGHDIVYNSTNQGEAMITNKGELTINDSVGTGVINYNYTGAADNAYKKGNYTISNEGKLTVNGGKITIANLSGHAKYPINNNSTTGDAVLVINGGHLYNYNTSAIRLFCNSTTYENSVTINGGLIEGYSAIWMQNPGANTVNGSLSITGGEVKSTAKAWVNGTSELKDVSSKIYCTTEGGAWSEDSAVSITGGTINENVKLSEQAPADISVDKENAVFNGIVDAPVVDAVAEVNGVGYADIQEAIKAAAPAGTVELLNDVTVDKWVMISETLTASDDTLITLAINGLTIDGNGYALTINDIESSGNGDYLFYGDITNMNVKDLTINTADGLVGGIGLKSGTISNVTFNGGVYGVRTGLAGSGNITIEGCTFKTNGSAIYYEEAVENIVVDNNTFEISDTANVILMRSNERFTNNKVISGRTVNVVSGSPAVTGNDFGDVRLKVYNEASATIFDNKINVLAFNDDSAVNSIFVSNTLSAAAKEVLDGANTFIAPELPTATVGAVSPETLATAPALTFSRSFVADPATDEQLEFYGGFYADFELTVNKDVVFNANSDKADGYLSGQYTAWSENWINVPFDDVTLKAGQTLKIMEYAAEMLGQSGLQVTYADVYALNTFNCGVVFSDAFLAANPDLEVKLELRMYNPLDTSMSALIGESYTFKPEKLTNANAFVTDMPNHTYIDAGGNKQEGYQMAIISGLDSLDYDLVGFEYQIGNHEVLEKSFTRVYDALVTTDVNGDEVSIDKHYLKDGVSNYVFGLLVQIGSQKNYTVKWRPFAEREGKRIYGDYREKPFKTK